MEISQALERVLSQGVSIEKNFISGETFLTQEGRMISSDFLCHLVLSVLRQSGEKFYPIACIKDYCEIMLASGYMGTEFNPIRRILDSSKPELANALTLLTEKVFSLENTPDPTARKFYRSALRKAIIQQAALNLYQPSKVDSVDNLLSQDFVLILQGGQGGGKSRFIKALQLYPEGYLGEQRADLRSKDFQMIITQHAAIELGEIETTINGNTAGEFKSFITRSCDKYRPLYLQSHYSIPRHCAIYGTTNEEQCLKDTTGNRRFVIVPFFFNPGEREELLQFVKDFQADIWREACQAIDAASNKIDSYRLSVGELEFFAAENRERRLPVLAEEELLDMLDLGEDVDSSQCIEFSAYELIDQFPVLKKYDARIIGKALALITQDNPGKISYASRMRNKRRYTLPLSSTVLAQLMGEPVSCRMNSVVNLSNVLSLTPNDNIAYVTCASLKDHFPSLKQYDERAIGKALNKLQAEYPEAIIPKRGKNGRYYLVYLAEPLPLPQAQEAAPQQKEEVPKAEENKEEETLYTPESPIVQALKQVAYTGKNKARARDARKLTPHELKAFYPELASFSPEEIFNAFGYMVENGLITYGFTLNTGHIYFYPKTKVEETKYADGVNGMLKKISDKKRM